MEHCVCTIQPYKCWSETTYHEFHSEELPREANYLTFGNQSSEQAGVGKKVSFLIDLALRCARIDTHLIMKYNLATDNIICDYFLSSII